jgi:uncharacterized membrane protein
MTIRVLLAGESWVSNSTHYKGWDFFSSTVYETGAGYLLAALAGDEFAVTHLPGHLAGEQFPLTMEQLSAYDVVILSDIGANTLLLHPDTWLRGKTMPNRLKLLEEWVKNGGGLGMAGGYMSFAGIGAAAKYYRSPVEAVLPVTLHTFDDRVEAPEGVLVNIQQPGHAILSGVDGVWPALLGYNEVVARPTADLLVTAGAHPLLAVQAVGQGRSLAWTSDIGPHWCPLPFVTWPGYGQLWRNALRWLARAV